MGSDEQGPENLRRGVVSRFSNNGNALIEDVEELDHVNLGPLPQSVLGKEVEYIIHQGEKGECLTEEYRPDGTPEFTYYYRDYEERRFKGPRPTSKKIYGSNPDELENKNGLLKDDL